MRSEAFHVAVSTASDERQTGACSSRIAAHTERNVLCGGATSARLLDGRWHFQHGPIDLIIGIEGEAGAVDSSVARAWKRFQTVLVELVGELKLLRSPVQAAIEVQGSVARRMVSACWPHRDRFITPMAAVAGAVADELIDELRRDPTVRKAFVNNGGDIALHLVPGERFRVGLCADLTRIGRSGEPGLDGDFEITAEMPSRGVATSGWRGRSFSLGIADSVTVLGVTAAEADAAATMIGNAVNVRDPAILRQRACELKDDTDLGQRLVTVAVGALARDKVDQALEAGAEHAHSLVEARTIYAAVLCLQGCIRVVGDPVPVGKTFVARRDSFPAPAHCC